VVGLSTWLWLAQDGRSGRWEYERTLILRFLRPKLGELLLLAVHCTLAKLQFWSSWDEREW
jgi:hypothetical protein